MNKAIVGNAAFAHESGIHVHGVKVLPLTYEIVPPELVGHERAIIIGKRSGKHGIQMRIEKLIGESVDDEDPRLLRLIKMIKDEFVVGERRYPIKEREFEELSIKAGFQIKKK